jgi:hypothetical protein
LIANSQVDAALAKTWFSGFETSAATARGSLRGELSAQTRAWVSRSNRQGAYHAQVIGKFVSDRVEQGVVERTPNEGTNDDGQ